VAGSFNNRCTRLIRLLRPPTPSASPLLRARPVIEHILDHVLLPTVRHSPCDCVGCVRWPQPSAVVANRRYRGTAKSIFGSKECSDTKCQTILACDTPHLRSISPKSATANAHHQSRFSTRKLMWATVHVVRVHVINTVSSTL